MPTININQAAYDYEENEVIVFPEGLIGLPKMRRAVLIPLEDYRPFCWMASLDDEKNRFIVVDPNRIFDDYREKLPAEFGSQLENREREVWTIVKISSDWQKTTVNLRAPLFIDRPNKSGAQVILTESDLSLAETLPEN